MHLVGADVFRPQPIRRVAEIPAELRNRVDVGLLGRRGQIADRHVLDHPAAHRAHLGHLKLLPERRLKHPTLSGKRIVTPLRARRPSPPRRASGFVQSPS